MGGIARLVMNVSSNMRPSSLNASAWIVENRRTTRSRRPRRSNAVVWNRLKPPFNLRQPCHATYSQIGCPQEAARVALARGPPLCRPSSTTLSGRACRADPPRAVPCTDHRARHYIGIREGERLVATAGERMWVGDGREVSAVCTDPDAQGRGYARALVGRVVNRMLRTAQTPFLHVESRNPRAIEL